MGEEMEGGLRARSTEGKAPAERAPQRVPSKATLVGGSLKPPLLHPTSLKTQVREQLTARGLCAVSTLLARLALVSDYHLHMEAISRKSQTQGRLSPRTQAPGCRSSSL